MLAEEDTGKGEDIKIDPNSASDLSDSLNSLDSPNSTKA